MNGEEWLRGRADQVSWQDVVGEYRSQFGSGASRRLAEDFGRSQRSARRWLAGTSQPSGQDSTDWQRARMVAATNQLRGATLSPGRMTVLRVSPGITSTYNAPWLEVRLSDRDVADIREWIQADMPDVAGRELGIKLVDAYGERGGYDHLSDELQLEDLPEGIDVE